MRKVKQHQITIAKQQFETDCMLWIKSPKSTTEQIKQLFSEIYGVSVVSANE